MLKKITLLATLSCAIVAGAISSAGMSAHAAEGKKSVTIATGKIASLNPLAPQPAIAFIGGQVYASLTRLDAKSMVQPNLATSWEISPDGLSYTFHLAKNAKFHDGKPVTSADVAFSVKTAQKEHRFGGKMFGPVERVDTPDPHTAIFRLTKRHAPVLLSTTSTRFLPIFPKHIFDDGKSFKKHAGHAKPIGAGPFKIKEVNRAEFVIVERFDGYFRPNLPKLDQIIFRVVTDQTAVRVGLEQKQFDIVVSSSTTRFKDLQRFVKAPHLSVKPHALANGGKVVLDFNHRVKPFDDVRVRRAIGHALDLNFISTALHAGWSQPAKGPISPASPFFEPSLEGGYEYNLDKANKLLDEAGLLRKADGVRFETSLIHASSFKEFFVVIPEYIVPALKKVGIKVNRQPLDRPSWGKRIGKWDYEMTVALPGEFLDPAIGVSRTYVCDNIKHRVYTNTSGYCNPEVDKLFAAGVAEPNHEKRVAIYREVQKLLWKDMPIVWMTLSTSPIVFNSDLVNVPIGGWGLYGVPVDEMYWK